jgi:hypothetical protein
MAASYGGKRKTAEAQTNAARNRAQTNAARNRGASPTLEVRSTFFSLSCTQSRLRTQAVFVTLCLLA